MSVLRQFQVWVVKTKHRNFAAWTAGIIFVGFLFISSIGTMTRTAERNAESERINAQISPERCAAIDEACSLKAQAESSYAAANGLKYDLFSEYFCVSDARRRTSTVCTPEPIYSWSEVFRRDILTDGFVLGLLFFWIVPFFTFSGLKLIFSERNKGWVRLSVVSFLCASLLSAFDLWDYYSNESFFLRWFGFSLAGLVLPIALKNVSYWVKSGFNESKIAEAPYVAQANISAPFNIEDVINDDDDSVGQGDEKKWLPAGFWDRFFARCIDLPISVLIVAVVTIFIPEFPEEGQYMPLWFILNMGVGVVVFCITMIFWDAFWIFKYGATPGKMLFGLIVKDKNGDMPSWKTAKTRSTAFLGQGLYYTFFFPVLQIVGAFSAWKRRDTAQPWDGILGTQVLQSPISELRRVGVRVVAVLLIVSTVLVMQVLKQVYKQQMRDQVLQQYRK